MLPIVQATLPISIRDRNLSRVLNIVLRAGNISRAEIVRQTSLSATTVSSLVSALLKSGFVQEAGRGKSSGGRPPILLNFNYACKHVLGVDMGATHVIVVVMDLKGQVVSHQRVELNVIDKPDTAIKTICDLALQALDDARLLPADILGVGVTIPTPLEGEKLDKLTTLYFPAWKDVDLIVRLRDSLGIPTYIDNDANAGVIAEKFWGEGQGYVNQAFVKLGTGVGCGLIINNEIYRGDGGTAGEIGHTTITPHGPRCRCGNRGCIEAFVGIPAILDEVKKRLSEHEPESLIPQDLDIGDVIEAALSGDPVARGVIEQAGSYLGIAIANLMNLINPALIILGGSLTEAEGLLLNPARAVARRRAMPKAAKEARITTSKLGADVFAIGAATLAMVHAFDAKNLVQTLNST